MKDEVYAWVARATRLDGEAPTVWAIEGAFPDRRVRRTLAALVHDGRLVEIRIRRGLSTIPTYEPARLEEPPRLEDSRSPQEAVP